MSDTVLNFIPTIPSFVPFSKNQEEAIRFLSEVYPISKIESTVTDNIEFIGQGENFESVSCNLCGSLIDIEDWQEAMEGAYNEQFNNLNFITPCCLQTTSLNDLNYNSPAGFSRFTITIIDAQKDLSQEELTKMKKILDVDIRHVWAHY